MTAEQLAASQTGGHGQLLVRFRPAIPVNEAPASGFVLGTRAQVIKATAVMIAGDQNDLRDFGVQFLEESAEDLAPGAIMHAVTEQDEGARGMIPQQPEQALLDAVHAPDGHEVTRLAHGHLIAEVQVRHGQPALSPVKEGSAGIQGKMRSHGMGYRGGGFRSGWSVAQRRH